MYIFDPKVQCIFFCGLQLKKKILNNTVLGHTNKYMFFPASNTFETCIDETE